MMMMIKTLLTTNNNPGTVINVDSYSFGCETEVSVSVSELKPTRSCHSNRGPFLASASPNFKLANDDPPIGSG